MLQHEKNVINVQVDSSLALLPGAQSCPDPARQLLHGAHGRAFLSAIGSSGGRCVCVDGYNGLAGEVRDGQLRVVARGDVTSEASIALAVSRESDQVGLGVRCRGHVGWALAVKALWDARAAKGVVLQDKKMLD